MLLFDVSAAAVPPCCVNTGLCGPRLHSMYPAEHTLHSSAGLSTRPSASVHFSSPRFAYVRRPCAGPVHNNVADVPLSPFHGERTRMPGIVVSAAAVQ